MRLRGAYRGTSFSSEPPVARFRGLMGEEITKKALESKEVSTWQGQADQKKKSTKKRLKGYVQSNARKRKCAQFWAYAKIP